jgi:hypothetical protein
MWWWIGIGTVLWVAASIAVAVLIGHVIRRAKLEDEPRIPSAPQGLRLDNPGQPAA